jgi:hypothetical protein
MRSSMGSRRPPCPVGKSDVAASLGFDALIAAEKFPHGGLPGDSALLPSTPASAAPRSRSSDDLKRRDADSKRPALVSEANSAWSPPQFFRWGGALSIIPRSGGGVRRGDD